MGSFGGGNPFPFELGGGPSSVEQVYRSLKQMIGHGGSADDETIEGDWRLAKATGLAAAFASEERAFIQAYPDRATDFLEVYESLFGIIPERTATDEARRTAVSDRYYSLSDATGPSLETDLLKIDSRFAVESIDWPTSKTTVQGRAFEDFDPNHADACGPAFNLDRGCSLVPNYSSAYLVDISFDAVPTTEPLRKLIYRAHALLDENLPAWCGFQVRAKTLPSSGFILDQSLLDFGSFDP